MKRECSVNNHEQDDKRTKIIATMGPASNTPEKVRDMIRAGANVFRLNFSHGEPDEHRRALEMIRGVAEKERAYIAVMQDLQGPKIRVGALDGGEMELRQGRKVTITTKQIVGRGGVIPTTYKGLPADVKPGDRLLLDDGLLELRVRGAAGGDVACTVVEGGLLRSHKGINLPGVDISAPSLTRKDLRDLKLGLEMGVDFVAMSFVRSGEDMKQLRRRVDAAAGASRPQIIAKIERPEAVHNLEEILEHADGVMVARGDLGVEMPPELVPEMQKQIIERANMRARHAITATQMLDSMAHSPRPTRAEASDVANAVLDGSGAVMLSGETAMGEYPVEAVAMMSRIVRAAEMRLLRGDRDIALDVSGSAATHDFSPSVARAAVRAAADLHARAILAFTHSAATAELVSKYRPRCMILGATLSEPVARRMAMSWGVIPIVFEKIAAVETLVSAVDKRLLCTRLVKRGDIIVITTGVPIGRAGTTNMIKIHRMGYKD